MQYIVLDFETTGINRYHDDEILQFAIINQNDEILFNQLCRPRHHISWPQAMKVHNITVEMVKDKLPFEAYIEDVLAVFDQYDFIVCYNIKFEQGILKNYGIDVTKYRFRDVMLEFAPIYGELVHGHYRWKSLSICANYFGYHFQPHDALQDVKATRFCFEKINEINEKNKITLNTWSHLFNDSIKSRGLKLYQEDKVTIVYQSESQIVGNVMGSVNYLVSLLFKGNKITKMTCSCPYAKNNRRCKHMAALLYKINE